MTFIEGIRWLNTPTYWLLAIVLVLLIVAYAIGQALKRQPESSVDQALLRRFNQRVQAWLMMSAILIAGFLFGYKSTVLLFGVVSFWALREFITMTPTRPGDHRTLFWVFFVLTPAQYVLVGLGDKFYGLYSIMIPVYGSLFIPARIALSGDYKRFLERSAKIQAGLLICVYSLSHAPALLRLNLLTSKRPAAVKAPAEKDQIKAEIENAKSALGSASTPRPWTEGSRAGLLFYFILVAELGDLFQHVWGKVLGRRVIAPEINASRTWEGFLAGVATTSLLGALLWWVTPFSMWEAACMALVIAVMGFAGVMTMSAIKRDRGVQDTGTLVQGHAGLLDRIDAICFSAPVFFHLTRLFFSSYA